MKKIVWLMAMLLCLILSGAAGEELTLVHVTDMHYLSPLLTDGGEAFMQVISAADGKVTHYTPQLMRAFVEEMLALKPQAVILSGDLTLNGAPQSHAELIELLQPLEEAGIQVLALSGNHDAGTAAYEFSGGQVIAIEGTTDEAFGQAYAHLGYDEAAARDSASLSYMAQVSPQLWCLLVDVNTNGSNGTVSEETFAWIEEQLVSAQEAGATVIAVSHQPVLMHNSLFTFGYVINNSARLLDLYQQYKVELNLCGHLHMQHVAQADGLVEIAASSLAVSPNQYGVLHVQGGRLLDYEMRQLDMAAWAERAGETDQNLLDFASYSAAFFDQTTRSQLEALLAGTGASPAEQEQMLGFALGLNAEYFAGTRVLTADDAAWKLWETYLPGEFFTYYMRSILNEAPQRMDRIMFRADDQGLLEN